LGVGLDLPATVDYSGRLAFVALGIDVLDPVGAQVRAAKPMEQDFEPADDLSFALATMVTELLVVVLDNPDLVEVAPKQGVVESQSWLWTAGSENTGWNLLFAFQVGSAIFSKMTWVEVVSL
jgi:hypothetical protein